MLAALFVEEKATRRSKKMGNSKTTLGTNTWTKIKQRI